MVCPHRPQRLLLSLSGHQFQTHLKKKKDTLNTYPRVLTFMLNAWIFFEHLCPYFSVVAGISNSWKFWEVVVGCLYNNLRPGQLRLAICQLLQSHACEGWQRTSANLAKNLNGIWTQHFHHQYNSLCTKCSTDETLHYYAFQTTTFAGTME
jgi:hypothetical protein